MKLTQAIVRNLLSYDQVTGLLRWRRRDRRWFKKSRIWKTWNTRFADKLAFTARTDGYLQGSIFGVNYKAHSIIWLWMTGSWPNPEIDHDNHDGADNRWENLYEVTHSKNMRNQSMSRRNKSGFCGVYPFRLNRWVTRISVDYKTIHIGVFDEIEDAIRARKYVEQKYGFSKAHGERRNG